MYFDAKPIDLEGATLAKGDPAGVDEMFEATREAQLRINNQYARADQLEKEIDARNDEILKATGEKLDNPFRMSFRADDLPEYMKFMEGRNPTELPGYSLLNFNNQKMMAQGYYFDRYEKRLKELADQKPDLAHIIRATEPPSMVVARRMRETEEKTADVFGRRGWTGTNPVGTMWDAVRDLPGTAAMFGGSLAGQAFSPTDMIGNLVGLASGGSMSIVRSALRNAVSNMAVQTALEPGVAAQRTQAGLDYGAVDALNSVLGAGAFGFAIDAIPRSINRPLVNRFGPDTPAGTFLSRNTPRGGFLTDAPINPIPGVVVDPGQIQAATDVIQAAQGQARNPELQALVDKASKGDIEAVRELASRAGVLEDPTIKGMFDHARIAGFDPGFADKVNAEFERVGLKERVDVGETEIRQAKTVVAAMDPTAEPFPVEAMRFVNEQRFPDLSNDVDLPAGTTGTNQHGRYLEIDGRTATVRTIDLKLATAADDIKTLRGRVDGLRGDWDQGQAGRALALEGKDGALRIVDGRGRLELAQRSQGEARAEAVVFRESDGWSIRDVEGLALLKNIREGKGDVVEAATVFRERPELLEGVLAATDFERQALALSRLSEAAFEMVQTGKADPRLAAVVAQYVGDQGRHAGVLDDLARMGVRDPDLARQTVPDLVPPRETAAANHVLLGVREGFDDAVPTLRGGAEVDEPLGSAAKAQTDRLGQELAPEVALAQKAAKQIADMEEKVGDIQREMTGEIERLTRQIERQRKNVTESRLAADRFSPETNKSFKNFTRRFRDREAFNRAEDNANARAAADQDLLKKLETDLAAKMEELGPKRVELNEAETDLANARRGVDGEKLYRQTMGAIALKREQDIRLAVSQALGLADRITPEGTKVAVVDDLKSPDGRALDAASDMATGDIQLALSAVDPMAKIGHEAVHTLVTKGHLSPDEVKQLTALAREAKTFEPAEWGDGDKSFKTRAEAEAYAKAENKTIVALNDEARYRDAYADRPNLETLIDEEAAASYIEARIKGTAEGPANTIVERVKQLLERIKQALAGFGFKSREDVVQAILNGEAARRAPVQEWMRANDMKAFAFKPDRTKTGWTFSDVASPNRIMEAGDWREFNRRLAEGDWMEVELPIRGMTATQKNVNPDFANPVSTNDKLPLVLKKAGRFFVQDGHHRLTREADAGRQTARVRLIDLDGTTQTDFPLVDRMETQARAAMRSQAETGVELPDGTKINGVKLYAIRAYHGSPHDFDRFDLSKIGTGEGAQAFGFGLYFAESRDVADSYRATLAARNVPAASDKALPDVLTRDAEQFGKLAVTNSLLIDGFSALDVKARSDVLAMMRRLLNNGEVSERVVSLVPIDVMDMLVRHQGASKPLLDNPSMLVDLLPVDANDTVAGRVAAVDVLAPYVALAAAERPLVGTQGRSLLQKALAARSANKGDLRHSGKVTYPYEPSNGRMYEVRINADPEHFLDWDKPLSQQSEKVRQAASKAWGIPEQQLHDELFARNVPEQISKKLRDEGVAGVKYLDQGSRVKGEGTRNYVVFDDNLIEIVAKDGTPVQGDKLYSLRSDDGPVIRGYHGTRATQKFDKFEIERSRNIGIHIGDVEDANMFAGTEPGLPLDFYSKVDRIEPPRLRDATMAALEGGRIIPVEMRFKNILRVPDLIREMKLDVWQPKKVAEVLEAHGVAFKKEDDAILSEARFASGKSWRPHDPDRWNQSPPGMAEANALIRQRVMEAGYDAIEYDGVDSGSGKPVYIVIKPGTVRNAASGDMMFSLRSDLDMSPEARKQRAEQRKNVEYVTLYHGTTDEGYDAIQSSGRVSAPAFFTPRRDVAESYGARVVEVRVPKDKLMIDFDLPGAKLLDLESANGYRDNPDWTIDDYLRHGQSVGVNDDVPLDPSKSDSPNLMYSMREDDPSPKDQIKATVRAYAEAYRDLKSNADALGVSPDDLAELVQRSPDSAPIAQRLEAARAQLAQTIGDEQATALTRALIAAAPLMPDVEPRAIADMVDNVLDQMFPDPPPPKPDPSTEVPTPLQKDMIDMARLEETQALVSVCRGI